MLRRDLWNTVYIFMWSLFAYLVHLVWLLLRESAMSNTLLTNVSLVAQAVKNPPAMWETWVQSLGCEDPLKEGMATHSSTLAWNPHGQRSLVGYSPWGRKASDTTEATKYSTPIVSHTHANVWPAECGVRIYTTSVCLSRPPCPAVVEDQCHVSHSLHKCSQKV